MLGGSAFEEDVRRVAQQLPGACEDQQADEDANSRVGVAPAGREDHQRRRYRADRTEDVGDYVTESALEVQAPAAGAGEDEDAREVHDEAEHGDRQHEAAQDLRRLLEALVGLREDPDRDRYQRDTVEEGGQDLGSLVAEAPVRGRGLLRQPHGEERDPQREGVREHVPRVCEEREAVRE